MFLTDVMAETAARSSELLSPEASDAVGRFVRSRRMPGGLYRGRGSAADPYYTLFGFLCLDALGYPVEAEEASRALRKFGDGDDFDLPHLASLWRCRGLTGDAIPPESADAASARLNRFRTPDGGFATVCGEERGSAYGAFMALLAMEASGITGCGAALIRRTIEELRSGDGGVANGPGRTIGVTTATAAAVMVSLATGAEPSSDWLSWLLARQRSDGGYEGTPGALGADLLSTATALLALRAAGVRPPAEKTISFIESLWDGEGGFLGHGADTEPDCEYTYYGLLGLGACAP